MNKVCAVAFLALVACGKSVLPVGYYCEHGVVKGIGSGDCMTVSPDGRATLVSMYQTPFFMRPDGKSRTKFVLLLAGVPSGTLEVTDEDRITVELTASVKTIKLRSDAPGFLN